MYLGIDLGTTNLKVILVDEQLHCVASETEAFTVSRPKPLWSEQDPNDWWRALNLAMENFSAKHPRLLQKVRGIGLAGQQHGAVLLDDKNCVLRPAILWNDGRSHQECIELMQAVPTAAAVVGSVIMPGFTAPKLLWVKKHEPDIFKKVHKVLLPKDYLRFMMSGDYATDMSDASGTGWLDVGRRTWSEPLLAACELTTDHMPKAYEGNAVTGKLRAEIAKRWGMSPEVRLVGGAGDNAASALSMGSVNTHTMYLSLGTSATFFIACDGFRPNPGKAIHTFCHAVPNYWHHMAVHLNGASTITWFSSLFGTDVKTLLEDAHTESNDLIFLPYLSGERTPHNNPYASGVFYGLTHTTTKGDMAHAVLEGTAFGIALGYQAILEDKSLQINEISVVGGGSRHDAWGIMFASALQHPLTYRKVREVGAAVGAAKLAWMQDFPEKTMPEPDIEKVLQPDESLVSLYQRKMEKFMALYDALR
ncbi:MAG: xylulokinase [Gammaproteobacteria bacterium RIFCSPHIGHO2_12_FULL_42_13]|nr:MAG: xylulokinase [Gammaproteobacteria bacterium RIFCSPHIGHO2_12_FULL_42_13]